MSDVRHATGERSVSVNDEPTEILIRGKKRLPYPEQIMLVLLAECAVWVNSGVDEEAKAIVLKLGKGSKPIDMLFWYSGSVGYTVALESSETAIAKPGLLPVTVIDSGKEHVLVVAH